jgi:hypothetical protein
VRFDGNDSSLVELAKANAMKIGAGHSFIIFLDGERVGGGFANLSVLEACALQRPYVPPPSPTPTPPRRWIPCQLPSCH